MECIDNNLEWDDADGGESFKSAVSLTESFTSYSICVNPLSLNIDVTDHSEFVDALSEGEESQDEDEEAFHEINKIEEELIEPNDNGGSIGTNDPPPPTNDADRDSGSAPSDDIKKRTVDPVTIPENITAKSSIESKSSTESTAKIVVKSLNFNQDNDCIAIATSNGFQINTLDPNPSKPYQIHKKVIKGGVTCIQMLHHSSLLALSKSKTPRNLSIIHAKTGKVVKELSFTSAVRRVEMNKLCIVVLTANGDLHTFVYNIHTGKSHDSDIIFVDSFNILHAATESARTVTAEGAMLQGSFFELSSHLIEGCAWLVSKSSDGLGFISVYRISEENDTPTMKLTNQVQAHSHSIGKVAIGGIHGCDNIKGQKVFATASVQGTLIRVFRLSDCEKLYELQRGSSPSTIHSMSFNMQASRMAVSSIKGTVHIFDLAEENQIKFPKPDSKNSIFKNFRRMTQKRKDAELNIIRSFARLRLKGEHARQSNTVSMLKTTKLENGEEEENIVIVLQDGKLFQFAVQSSGRKRPTRADDLMIRREKGHNM